MECEPLSSSVNKPSGLRRPSKLPVLRNKSSQILLPKQEASIESAKQTNAVPKIQKRRSIATLGRPNQNGINDSARISKPLSCGTNARSAVNYASKPSTGTRASVAQPPSRGNQQRHPPPATKPSKDPEEEENHDQLSSLDSFRSASRPSSRPSSRDESPPELQEYVEPTVQSTNQERTKSTRLSLSDRTIESIQNLPSTPKDRRRSNFFSPMESPMGPPLRPSSSLSRDASGTNSRPTTSDGSMAKPAVRPQSVTKKASMSAKPASRTSLGGFGFTPARSATSAFGNARKESGISVPQSPRSPSPTKKAPPVSVPSGIRSLKAPPSSKTTATRQRKARLALADAFGPAVRDGVGEDGTGEIQQTEATVSPGTSKRAVSNPSNASSAALRQQIAAAKAAARKEKTKVDSHQGVSLANGNESLVEIDLDPFNQAPKDGKHILCNRINTARMDGKLNIAAMGLKRIADEVLRMYDAAAMEESKVSWAEVVDLSRLNAADNEFEELGDDVFPDTSAEDLEADDETTGNQFGGLEMLDVHGNSLYSLPIGLRRLERLTTLNVAHNRLENGALEVISQITSLKDLNIGHNALSGTLPTTLCGLQHLRTLNLQSNRLLALPDALRELVSLKVLNVSSNQLTALPMESIQELSLTELDASNNALIGSLFPPGAIEGHRTLQSLKVSNNSLAALTFSESLNLPQLRTLDVMNNHLTGLPPVATWLEIITLIASDNKITDLPIGFTALGKLRNVNLSSNELRLLDPAIARMESLESLILASNPLREKRFLTMSASDIKRDLKSRLEPLPAEDDELAEKDDFHDARDSFSPQPTTSPTTFWAMKNNGTLELASRGLSDSINDGLGSFLRSHEVKQLQLSSNKLTVMPPALWLAQELRVLDLSLNPLDALYLSDELELPSLQELNLSKCGITTLEPLVTQLQAPNLQALNISINRLIGAVPTLRSTYPALTTLLANDNKFTSVTADSLRGLHTVNLASNDIDQLPAEVGLLWDEGLRSLEIGSNAFRVPNYRILEKGTEACLRWLRGRLPAAEAATVVNGDSSSHTGLN